MEQQICNVAIVGAGASGVLLAGSLVRPPLRLNVLLIDPTPGRGPAFGSVDPHHLLNTRAGNMSLDVQSPRGFVDWLNLYRERPGGWDDEDFAPRRDFGDYLEQRLGNLETRTPGLGSTRVVRSRAISAERGESGWSIRLATRDVVQADTLVLATGVSRPRPMLFHGRDEIEPFVLDDPWDDAALKTTPPGGTVLLIGTGLTAMDVATSLWRKDPQTKVVAVSRHGLLPRIHALPSPAAPVISPPYPKSARELYAKLRAAAEFVEGDASLRHGVFLNLREISDKLWAGLPDDERLMFLRHFRRYWEVERHRLPPAQAEVIRTASADGRLDVVRGRLAEAKSLSGGGAARVALLTSTGPQALSVTRVINCTGPEADVFRSRNPLLLDLLAQGAAIADPLGLGLHVDDNCAVLDSRGQATPGLYAAGFPTQGRFFGTNAVMEIRAQTARLAELILVNAAVQGPTEPQPA